MYRKDKDTHKVVLTVLTKHITQCVAEADNYSHILSTLFYPEEKCLSVRVNTKAITFDNVLYMLHFCSSTIHDIKSFCLSVL